MTKPDLYGIPETNASKLQGDNDALRALNAELVSILQRLVEASDRQSSALPVIEEARAAIAKAKGEAWKQRHEI